ncbi:condensation domain-containing protein [Nonomuraea sp. B1E8]|uniref:condensation domain-containing protein n=1 Tax=unclassified Nonomuraea TaxID=2593643 RepID=UPI00325E0029
MPVIDGSTSCLVEFRGTRSCSSAMTWGQQWMWREAVWFDGDHAHLNVPFTVELPHGTTLPTALTAVRALVEQHESLRTTFVETTGDQPRQAVASAGSLRVSVCEASPHPADRWRDQVEDALMGTAFQLDEWPVRVAIVTQDGEPRYVVVVLFHLAVDGWAVAQLRDRLVHLLRAEQSPGVEIGLQPHDQATYEASDRGQQVAVSSLAYWEQQVAGLCAEHPFPASAGDGPATYREMYMESRALAEAVCGLSEVYRVGAPTLMLTIWAALLGLRSPARTCESMIYCSNRVGPRRRAAAGTFVQDAPFSVDVRGLSFPELLSATVKSALSAYRHGQYDPRAVARLVYGPAGEARHCVGLPFSINLNLSGEVPCRAAAGGTPTSSPGDTILRWTRDLSQDRMGRRVYLVTFARPPALGCLLRADTSLLSPAEIAGFLRAMESLAVAAAARPRLTAQDMSGVVRDLTA